MEQTHRNELKETYQTPEQMPESPLPETSLPAVERKMPVLVCHSEEDFAQAEKLQELLEKNGFVCLHSEKDDPSDPFALLEDLMDCSCVLILVSEHAERKEKIDAAIREALNDDLPLVFVYLKECSFTALPVDNADRIKVFYPYTGSSEEIDKLMRYLEGVNEGEIVNKYTDESFGSETVKERVESADCFVYHYSGGSSSGCIWSLLGHPQIRTILYTITAAILFYLFRNDILDFVKELIRKIVQFCENLL